MRLQIMILIETLATDVAHEILQTHMSAAMSRQMCTRIKILLAQRTFVRPVAVVRPHVPLQILGLLETQRAQFTLKRTHAHIHRNVPIQMRNVIEGFLASVAHVRFETAVHSEMFGQVGTLSVGFFA